MTTTHTRLLGVAAAVTLAIGLLVGFMPTSTYGVNCGSAFVESRDANVADLMDTFSGNSLRAGRIGGVAAACDDKRSDRQLIAVGLLMLAVGLGVATAVSRGAARRAPSGSRTPGPHQPAERPRSD